MQIGRRKTPDLTHGSEEHFYVQSFTALALFFNSSGESVKVTPHTLANVALTIRRFMEEKLGRGSSKPRSCTKIPHRIFHDFSLGGGLCTLLKVVFNVLREKESTVADIAVENTALMESIVRSCYSELLSAGIVKAPIVFFNKVPVGLINTLSRIVLDHFGEVTSLEDNATHVINWNDEVDNFPEELTEDFIRILEIKHIKGEGYAYVHWWYYPECYDEWLSGTEINPYDPPDLSSSVVPKTKWNVCCRFILDCELFNEWGSEVDYENDGGADDANADSQNKKARNRKKVTTSGIKPPKEAPIVEACLVTEKVLADLLPASLTREALTTVSLTVPAEGATQIPGTVSSIDARGANAAVGGKRRRGADDSAAQRKAEKEQVVPRGRPEWFDAGSIGELEFLHLGNLLDLKSDLTAPTSANYLRIRALIIGLYELNTSHQLSVTDCRRKISGDVSVVIKVYDFLNAYNIINFGVKSECRAPSHLVGAVVGSKSAHLDKEPHDDRLRELAVLHGGDWQSVSVSLGGLLSPQECAARFAQSSSTANDSGVNKRALNHGSVLVGRSDLSARCASASVHDVAELVAMQGVLLQKYMENRYLVVEEKLKLLGNVETLIELKREELDIERKDLQIQAAQLSSLRSQNAHATTQIV